MKAKKFGLNTLEEQQFLAPYVGLRQNPVNPMMPMRSARRRIENSTWSQHQKKHQSKLYRLWSQRNMKQQSKHKFSSQLITWTGSQMISFR